MPQQYLDGLRVASTFHAGKGSILTRHEYKSQQYVNDRFFLCMSINLAQSLYVNLGPLQVSTLPVTPGRVRSPGPVRRHYGAVSPVRRSPVQPGAVDEAVQRTL